MDCPLARSAFPLFSIQKTMDRSLWDVFVNLIFILRELGKVSFSELLHSDSLMIIPLSLFFLVLFSHHSNRKSFWQRPLVQSVKRRLLSVVYISSLPLCLPWRSFQKGKLSLVSFSTSYFSCLQREYWQIDSLFSVRSLFACFLFFGSVHEKVLILLTKDSLHLNRRSTNFSFLFSSSSSSQTAFPLD